ncbi:MAG: MauE/DoxX family redox-associated membrane protein [Candidatus Kapaibacteriales bacterium]
MRVKLHFQILIFVFRLFVGFVFVYAAIGKIAEPQVFAKEILNYKIVGIELARAISIFLPWIELIVGIFLIFGIYSQASAFISSFLVLIFTFAVLFAMVRGLNINCGCFAHHVEYVGWKKIIENLCLLLFSLFIFLYSQPSFFINTPRKSVIK